MSGARSDIDVPASTLLNSDAIDRAPMASEAPVERELSARDRVMAAAVAKRERELEVEVKTWDDNSSGTLESQIAEQSVARKPSGDEREEDRVYTGPYADPDEPIADTAPVEAKPAREMAGDSTGGTAPAAPARQPTAPQQPTTFPIDIDGQQVYVTQEQMAHLARMGAIANQALYAYNQGSAQSSPPAPVSTPERGQPAPSVSDDRIRETARAIQYGDEQAAAAALKELIADVSRSVPQSPAFDPDAHRRSILSDVRREQQLHADTNVIRAEYADVLGNPILADAAARQVAAIRQHVVALGIQASDLDIYREAGNRVRQAFGTAPPQSGHQGQTPAPAGQTAPQAPNMVVRRSVADIDGRKRAAPQRTAAVIDRRSAAPEAPRPPTGSDLVEQMRKSRGQSPAR